MCSTCGCGQPDDHVKIVVPGEKDKNKNQQDHSHDHTHGHSHDHNHHGNAHDHQDTSHSHEHDHNHDHHAHDHSHAGHDHSHSHDNRQLALEQDILYKNNLLAERNRGYFDAKNILALNLVSSPGSGKTTFLEKTIQLFKDGPEMAVIEGDQQTSNDADRIAATGVKVAQINTGKGCHLDAHMILHAIQRIEINNNSVLMIENVGNLVCPSMFDLGEKQRVVIMSVTEGEDKPLKYPDMFMSSQICVINKIDLLPYLEFDLEKAKDYAMRVNPKLKFFEVSATSGEGMDQWVDWLLTQTR
ncbi:MAG: hydrogenase nickel incorporation protein HypB [Cyclobacteriaceae bacterium]|jgi:hydrogenase nickel incorporation protein HypB